MDAALRVSPHRATRGEQRTNAARDMLGTRSTRDDAFEIHRANACVDPKKANHARGLRRRVHARKRHSTPLERKIGFKIGKNAKNC
jgi:hypothetical protein